MPTYKEIMKVLDRGTSYVSVLIGSPISAYGINGLSTFQARKSVFAEKVADWEVVNINPTRSLLDRYDSGLCIEILPPDGEEISGYGFEAILSGTKMFRDKGDAEYYEDEKANRSRKRDAQRESFDEAIEKMDVENAFQGSEEFQERMESVINELKDIKEAERLREEHSK